MGEGLTTPNLPSSSTVRDGLLASVPFVGSVTPGLFLDSLNCVLLAVYY
jgi:hypothetical protein